MSRCLSPSTEKEDRTRKLDFYRSFATVEAILFVWQDTRRVELHERTEGGWLVRDMIGGGTVALGQSRRSRSRWTRSTPDA